MYKYWAIGKNTFIFIVIIMAYLVWHLIAFYLKKGISKLEILKLIGRSKEK